MGDQPGCPCSICEDAYRTAAESDTDDSQGLNQTDSSDILRARIAALVADELIRQADRRNEYSFRYTPLDDEGNDLPQLIGLDTSIDSAAVADAVIRELKLEAVIGLASSWHRDYDVVPAYDPQNPSDSDIAYDDAGFQILHTLGLVTDHSKCFGCDGNA
jgi:hypothetical protein